MAPISSPGGGPELSADLTNIMNRIVVSPYRFLKVGQLVPLVSGLTVENR
jgi:hypothetical protein